MLVDMIAAKSSAAATLTFCLIGDWCLAGISWIFLSRLQVFALTQPFFAQLFYDCVDIFHVHLSVNTPVLHLPIYVQGFFSTVLFSFTRFSRAFPHGIIFSLRHPYALCASPCICCTCSSLSWVRCVWSAPASTW